jgi:hypothetical protein
VPGGEGGAVPTAPVDWGKAGLRSCSGDLGEARPSSGDRSCVGGVDFSGGSAADRWHRMDEGGRGSLRGLTVCGSAASHEQ